MSSSGSKRSSFKYIAYKPLEPSQSPLLPSVGRSVGRRFSSPSTRQVRRTNVKNQLDKRSIMRVLQLALALLAVSSLLSFSLYMVYTVFGKHNLTVAVGDAVLLDDVSTFWCASVKVTYEDQATGLVTGPRTVGADHRELIRMPHRPTIPYTWRPKSKFSVTVDAGRTRTLQIEVSDGVHIKIQTCARPRVGLLVFSNVKYMEQWKLFGHLSKNLYAARMEVGCDSLAENGTVLKVKRGGFYFIVVNNRGRNQTSTAKIRVSEFTMRSDFEAEFNKTDDCAVSPTCAISLAYFSSQVTAIRVSSNLTTVPFVDEFTWSCFHRWWVYVAVFGGTAAAVLCVILVLQQWIRRSTHVAQHPLLSSDIKQRNYEGCASDAHNRDSVTGIGQCGIDGVAPSNPDTHRHSNISINS